jgi:hypothetical protein
VGGRTCECCLYFSFWWTSNLTCVDDKERNDKHIQRNRRMSIVEIASSRKVSSDVEVKEAEQMLN